jgi:hypothetical protein
MGFADFTSYARFVWTRSHAGGVAGLVQDMSDRMDAMCYLAMTLLYFLTSVSGIANLGVAQPFSGVRSLMQRSDGGQVISRQSHQVPI